KACKRYTENVKKELGITSRKVTKYFTAKELQFLTQEDEIKLDFVLDVKDTILRERIPASYVLNLDQSGYTYAVKTNHTLSYREEKNTEGFVESHNKMTHSYSIQVAIAADGTIPGPLHICFQEATAANFGPNVKKQMNEHQEIY